MTKNGNFKRRVRARAEKTGESYTTSLMHLRHDLTPEKRVVRLAVAQSSACDDPRDTAALRTSGQEMRHLMRLAHQAGATVAHFPEGAICSPSKRILSSTGAERIGPSDWNRFAWDTLREELDATRELSRELGLWTVFGSVHQLSPPHRPYNSLYVISDQGDLATRYDERMLSNTKISFMYTPGSVPVTFDVSGVRFGCALGMESHFPEIFTEYEGLDVHCVLFSTTGGSSSGPSLPPNDQAFAAETLGHAASNNFWVSFSLHARHGRAAPAGIAAPEGRWAAQCPADGAPSIVVADISNDPTGVARPWRRTARSGIYEPHKVKDDPRSGSRDRF